MVIAVVFHKENDAMVPANPETGSYRHTLVVFMTSSSPYSQRVNCKKVCGLDLKSYHTYVRKVAAKS